MRQLASETSAALVSGAFPCRFDECRTELTEALFRRIVVSHVASADLTHRRSQFRFSCEAEHAVGHRINVPFVYQEAALPLEDCVDNSPVLRRNHRQPT